MCVFFLILPTKNTFKCGYFNKTNMSLKGRKKMKSSYGYGDFGSNAMVDSVAFLSASSILGWVSENQ